jgi:hypothetical protein
MAGMQGRRAGRHTRQARAGKASRQTRWEGGQTQMADTAGTNRARWSHKAGKSDRHGRQGMQAGRQACRKAGRQSRHGQQAR